MHFLIFWGVTIQIIGTAINLMQMALFTPFALENFPRDGWYFFYEFIMDLAGVFILVGVGMALYPPAGDETQYLGYAWDDWYALILLTLLPLAGFTTEAMRLIAADPPWAGYPLHGLYFCQPVPCPGSDTRIRFWVAANLCVDPYLFGRDFRRQHPLHQAAPPDLCPTQYHPPPTPGDGRTRKN